MGRREKTSITSTTRPPASHAKSMTGGIAEQNKEKTPGVVHALNRRS